MVGKQTLCCFFVVTQRYAAITSCFEKSRPLIGRPGRLTAEDLLGRRDAHAHHPVYLPSRRLVFTRDRRRFTLVVRRARCAAEASAAERYKNSFTARFCDLSFIRKDESGSVHGRAIQRFQLLSQRPVARVVEEHRHQVLRLFLSKVSSNFMRFCAVYAQIRSREISWRK